ncbi:hypothetical protein B0F90DRAFT_1664843 [Multifurca ochricompacta]|uniref:Uncharacterized protein n=1 Tax=Multifurca ochricompacta TaxID=376703 RepID=A0AAD4QTL9_9AGAM|nr:hypothetical protein B0F90DRAFT_1664843 [Multifurca ochricompacta]
MSLISPADTNLVPRREFIRDQRPASSFSILALSGTALLRLYGFLPDVVLALRKHLDTAHLILSSRELIQNNFCELSLDGKPWSNSKSTRSEKLLIEIFGVLYRSGHNFLSTLDYGREQDDRVVMAFSRPSSPSPLPFPPLSFAAPAPPFHRMSNNSLAVTPHPIKVPFAISFVNQDLLRVIAPPLHLTPAILQTVRGSWPRFQEDTFTTDSLRHILSLLSSLDGFGFTLLTSVSFNSRSRSKDLWVFTGLSQTTLPDSQRSSPVGSRTDLKAAFSDKARERRQSYPAPAKALPATNLPPHTRVTEENFPAARAAHPSTPALISLKSGVGRKPAPRAQLPISVAHSTASNGNIHDADMPDTHLTSAPALRMELQSSVGSTIDMTGIGTQKYGRTDEPDTNLHQQASRKLYSRSPGVTNSYFPSTSTSVKKPLQSSEPPQSHDRMTGKAETARVATAPSIPPRSRHSPLQHWPNSRHTDNLDRCRERAWAAVSGPRGCDPKENILPNGWIPASAGMKESKASGDHLDESSTSRSPPELRTEEQEVKFGVPEPVQPKHQLARSGETTLVAEAPRANIHRTKGGDCLPHPMKHTPDKRDNDLHKIPTEGWVLVNVGQPSIPSALQASKPPSQLSLQKKQSFPPTTSRKPQSARSPYSTGSRGILTGSPVGSGHKKVPSNPNPSSMSPTAKAIVIIDAMEAKRKAAGGDVSQSNFRKFFSLSRPDSPSSKSPGKERKLVLSSGGSKSKILEQEDDAKKREGSRERWRLRGMAEVTQGDRRMSVD